MEFGLYCDCCNQLFDAEEKKPMILPLCGHTVCKECAQLVQSMIIEYQNNFLKGDSYCKSCQGPQTIDDFSTLKINQKLFAVVSQGKKRTQSSSQIEHLIQSVQNVGGVNGQSSKAPLYSFQSGFSGEKKKNVSAQQILSGVPAQALSQDSRRDTNAETEIENKQQIIPQQMKSQSAFNSSLHSITQSAQKTENNQQDLKKKFCKIHLDKPIEYFCNKCLISVCSKCMFHHHNGHELCQLTDAINQFYDKIVIFNSDLEKTQLEYDECQQIISKQKSEIEKQREKQIQIIDAKFQELHLKLDERKVVLAKDITHKFDNFIFKANDKIRSCKDSVEEVQKMQSFYLDLYNNLKNKKNEIEESDLEQINILNRLPETEKFIYDSSPKIRSLQLNSRNYKIESQSVEIVTLRPIDVSANNAMNLIQSIHFDEINTYSLQQSNQKRQQIPPNNNTPENMFTQQEQEFSYPKQFASPIKPVSQQNSVAIQQELSQVQKIPMPNFGQFSGQPPFLPKRAQSTTSDQNVFNDQQSSKSGPAYSSKFAKLKFSRQGTDREELTLQVDSPREKLRSQEVTIANIPIPMPIKSQEEEKQQQLTLTQEEQEELKSQQLRLLDHAIYCIGDQRFILMFDYKQGGSWNQIYFDKTESDYQGTLKFMSIILINKKKKEFLMTGGCNIITLDPSAQCFKFTIPTIRSFKEVQQMKQGRYGHASVYINSLVLVLGGFNHRDDESQAPHTLNSCEKYSIKENEWTPIASMHQERAYFSACRVKEEFIYVFGGFQNYETTNTIEFYNIMLDKWTSLSVSMPLKLAKYGLAKTDENQVLIAGGLLVDNSSSNRNSSQSSSYSCVNTVYKFDCNTLKWTKLAKLNFRRTLYSSMPVKENGLVFALGGNLDGINEAYDIRKRKWNTCQSYTSILGANDLQSFAICSINTIEGSETIQH